MPDRLDELRRQRALIAAHLAWLDREIEAASGANTPALPPAAQLPQPVVATALVAAALKAKTGTPALGAPAASDVDSILEEYRVPADTLKTDVRKGCFLYFAAALLAVAATVVILYFLLPRSPLSPAYPAAERPLR